MKWYFAINERATHGDVGLHARLAVLSARHLSGLSPHLLYTGARNAFTAWMERQGVRVIDVVLPFAEVIRDRAAHGAYSLDFMGHWLRTSICTIEQDDAFVLYTDCDVMFLLDPDLAACRPGWFACAPEFKVDGWNYFNSGVMVMNVAALRSDYPAFQESIVAGIRSSRSMSFRDQLAYNEFYRGRWTRLDPLCNWKPYWGLNERAAVLHFHGPKFQAIHHIVDEAWPWRDEHERQIGSLFAAHVDHYRYYLQRAASLVDAAEPELRAMLQGLAARCAAFGEQNLRHPVDLGFMEFRLFP